MDLVLAVMSLAFAGAVESGALFEPPADLMEDTPERFSRFHFKDNEEMARWLGRYLWYHYSHRLGHNAAPFNKEYIATSDIWIGGSMRADWDMDAQDTLRSDLLSINIQPSGYVWTHQHFSHADEFGWPFPMWVQGHGGVKTAGWHFQHKGYGWAWQHYLNHHPESPFGGDKALVGWQLHNLKSKGIVDNRWHLESTGDSPALTTPEGVHIDAFNAPFLQLRWTRTGAAPHGLSPYIEWLRDEDEDFGLDRRVYFQMHSGNPEYEAVSGTAHSLVPMHEHPRWEGTIKRMRIGLAPGESDVDFTIDSFFTVYNTRHTINNPIYIMTCWRYFTWTGDLDFLRATISQMRLAMRYQQTVMGGLEHNHIRVPWVGHDGMPGFTIKEDGSKEIHHGHGIGNNYWDLLPFGWDDMYATAQYYRSLLVMADIEDAISEHPEWSMPGGVDALDPQAMREHAEEVKKTANRKFWSKDTGRFFACIDKAGDSHDFGFTFLNLDSIWYDIASDKHAKTIMEWLEGERIIEGDTSTGEDIYHWRFGPRATTRRNIEWYGWVWSGPESIPWGGQVQDGGAVLGFSFYDLWARLKVLGPDNAWKRLGEIVEWEKEVWAEGGYRPYYADGSKGTTLQGGGTAGGLGIDYEFFESSLIPSIITYGFMGIEAEADALYIAPNLPEACPEMGIANLQYRDVLLAIKANSESIEVALDREPPLEPIRIRFEQPLRLEGSKARGKVFDLTKAGVYRFMR